MPHDSNNSFIFSANKSKKRPDANPKWPDWRGEITIDGKTYELAGWIREKRSDGSKFISGTVKPKASRVAPTAQNAPASPGSAFPTPSQTPPSGQFTPETDDDPPF